MSLVEMWPVLGIEVRTPAVELFVPDQDTLDVLARLAAEGIYDPQNQVSAAYPRRRVGGRRPARGRTPVPALLLRVR